jgi:peroxiredoxin
MSPFLLLAILLSAGCSKGCSNPAAVALADSSAPADVFQVDDFACLDHTGTFQRLSRHSDAKLVVLYVFANECPIVRQQARQLSELADEFAPRGVRVLCLDSSPQDTRASVVAEAAALELTLPILLDETQCVGEMLGLTRTGEALVLETATWKLLWRGPLDDRLEYGGQRDAATRAYLREALEAGLAGKAPPPDQPLAKGCAITYLQPKASHEVTYVRDVAPILAQRCVPCHRQGGIGPWKMDGYEKLRGWSEMTREVVLARFMPPWHADPAHGDFLEDVGLEPEEARALVHWVENGTPRGEGEDPLAGKIAPLPEWPLGPPDLIVDLGEHAIPATGRIPNVDIELVLEQHTEDRWVRALDLRPSNYAILHHAFAFVPGLQELDTLVDQLDELPEAWREKGRQWLADNPHATELPPEYAEILKKRAFQGRTYFAKYFPGQLVEEYPRGAGKLLPARSKLLFELHYTTVGAPATDRPRLGIYFHDAKPEHEIKVASTWNRKVELRPHERREVSAGRAFDHPLTVYSLSPHMHYRGRSMRFTAVLPDGTSEALLSVTNYVFDWQANYTLREPRSFPAGTRIVCDAIYDNTAQNEQNPDPSAVVHFGSRTDDEMFVGYIVYTRD